LRTGRIGSGAVLVATVMLLVVPAAARAEAGSGGPARDRVVAAEADAAGVPGPLTITVEANGAAAGTAPGPSVDEGAPMAWSYDVTNAGTAGLWALYLWHDGVGAADCPDGSLAPGETVRCTAAGAAEAGTQTAAVRAWAWDEAGMAAAGEALACYTGLASLAAPAPAIDLEALVAGRDADAPPGPVVAPGQVVTFRYQVRNTGNATVWGLWVHDRVLGDVTCPTRTLAPGEQIVCRVRRTAEAGWHSSSVTAGATDFAGTEVLDEDLLYYFGAAPVASVDLEALVEGFDEDTPPGPRVGRPGETIAFTYLVTNTGGLPLAAVRVRDDAPRTVTCPARTLAPGETMICTASAVAELGEFASTGRVTARAGEAVVRDSDPVYYHVRLAPRVNRLTVEVSVNGREADDPTGPSLPVGRQAHFVYVVTYHGNNRVYNVTVQDPFVPASLLSCDGDGTLDKGETLRCTATVPVMAGQYASLVTVVSWDADGRRVTAEDPVHYYGMA
jgi:uncharacterized repeat protein (TIGR01451 family)